MNEINNTSIFSDLLDTPLEEIAGLASYEIPPDGVYRLLVEKVEQKPGINLNSGSVADVISFNYKVVEVIELTDPTLAADLLDDKGNTKEIKFNESFFFKKNDPIGVGKTKDALKTNFGEVATAIGARNLMEMINGLEGLEVVGVLKRRVDANDAEKVYAQMRKVRLA